MVVGNMFAQAELDRFLRKQAQAPPGMPCGRTATCKRGTLCPLLPGDDDRAARPGLVIQKAQPRGTVAGCPGRDRLVAHVQLDRNLAVGFAPVEFQQALCPFLLADFQGALCQQILEVSQVRACQFDVLLFHMCPLF